MTIELAMHEAKKQACIFFLADPEFNIIGQFWGAGKVGGGGGEAFWQIDLSFFLPSVQNE